MLWDLAAPAALTIVLHCDLDCTSIVVSITSSTSRGVEENFLVLTFALTSSNRIVSAWSHLSLDPSLSQPLKIALPGIESPFRYAPRPSGSSIPF